MADTASRRRRLEGRLLWHEPHRWLCARVQFEDTNRKAATVTAVPMVNQKYNIQRVTYEYDGVASDSEVYGVSESSLPTEDLKIRIVVHMADGSTEYTDIDPLDFVLSITAVNLPLQYEGGQKGGIVEVFG